jgi:hypothetical protein
VRLRTTWRRIRPIGTWSAGTSFLKLSSTIAWLQERAIGLRMIRTAFRSGIILLSDSTLWRRRREYQGEMSPRIARVGKPLGSRNRSVYQFRLCHWICLPK